jgi:hypothetical protein
MNSPFTVSSTTARTVLAGVMAAGLTLSTATTTLAAEPDLLLAKINDRPLHLSDVERAVSEMPLGDQVEVRAQIGVFAEAMVREEILFQSMLATNFDAEPELRERIKKAVLDHLIEKHVSSRIGVSDAAVEKFYAQNPGSIRAEELAASRIVLATRGECTAMATRIDSEATFRELARKHSIDRETGERGGEWGYVMNHIGPFGFEPQLFELEIGEVGIFDYAGNCHLIRVDSRSVPPLPELAAVSEYIRGFLETRQERTLLSTLLERSQASVSVERIARIPSSADAHAGHGGNPPKADPHAGHAGHGDNPPKVEPHAGHAGHGNNPPKVDSHAGHAGHGSNPPKADPHAGHQQATKSP